jgi:predicted MPP superfamily phosphohydrolase
VDGRDLVIPGLVAIALLAWIGHACFWTYWINYLYGRRLSKRLLKPWRLATGVLILSGPLLLLSAVRYDFINDDWELMNGLWGRAVLAYVVLVCLPMSTIILPLVTIARLRRRAPDSQLRVATRTLDLRRELGGRAIGDGYYRRIATLPLNGVFRVDFTDLELAPPRLPAAWDGLTILMLSDLHFHGTPSRAWFERILDEIAKEPTPDLVVLAGDFVDSDAHREWIAPILGRLKWTECGIAILGNHDEYHDPDRVRAELEAIGYRVLSNRVETVPIRGVPCELIGHEGPWFPPGPRLYPDAKTFRICASHTPDNFYWGIVNDVDLMLCGHVHGGQIRLPVFGSIFVPSVYSRRFDMGVFGYGTLTMVVGRGLSGKEPIRFLCNPQVIRITLKRPRPGGVG